MCKEDSFLKEHPAQVTNSASQPAQLHLASLSSLSSVSIWQRYPQGPSDSLLCLCACLGQKRRAVILGEEFWSAVGFHYISKEFPLPLIIRQERKAFSISKMREIIHRLGGVVSAHAEFDVSDSFHRKDWALHTAKKMHEINPHFKAKTVQYVQSMMHMKMSSSNCRFFCWKHADVTSRSMQYIGYM